MINSGITVHTPAHRKHAAAGTGSIHYTVLDTRKREARANSTYPKQGRYSYSAVFIACLHYCLLLPTICLYYAVGESCSLERKDSRSPRTLSDAQS